MHRFHLSVLFAGLVLLASSVTCAAQTSRVLFNRATSNSDGTLKAATIYRINADGTGFSRLAPMTSGVYRFSPTWSPHGTYIAYVFGTSTTSHYDLYVMNSTGARRRRITSGPTDHMQPAWRPDGGMIAFVTTLPAGGDCLDAVRPNGTGQHNLFCPPGPAFIDNTPQWSADGRHIYISTGYNGSGLDPQYYSHAYSVNAANGAATLLASQTLDDPRIVYFAPDGRHGLYASSYQEGAIDAIDFSTNFLTPRTSGYAPLYSHDGHRFAYTQTRYGSAPDFGSWQHVFVMAADGSSDHEVTPARVNNLEYVADQWSKDDTCLLLDRTVYAPISPGSGTYAGTTAMRIFHVATSAYTTLPNGSASDWYQSP